MKASNSPFLPAKILLSLCFSFFISNAALAGGIGDRESTNESPRSGFSSKDEKDFQRKRDAMVVRQIEARGISDEALLRAMNTVPRHRFVPDEELSRAYNDHALPIGFGQTISQPFIVAYMTDLLAVQPGDRVLEIGTGSGYQAAVLAELTEEVYTMEIIEELVIQAVNRLKELGYTGVNVIRGDGYWGWPDASPYDGIIVTAAAGHIPPVLVEQLALGGRMVIPVGHSYEVQYIFLVEKALDGTIYGRQLLPVRFVPFTGQIEAIDP